MEIVVDGIVFQRQPRGGISRIYQEMLPRLCNMDESVWIRLLMYGRSQQPLPRHPRIDCRHFPIESFLRPRRIWRRITTCLKHVTQRSWIGNSSDKIWHSTYYTLPSAWKGHVVVTIPDMVLELFPDLFDRANDEHFRVLKRKSVEVAEMVICISQSTRKDVQRFYGLGPSRLKVIPLACSEEFSPREQMTLERPFILYVGTRLDYKGFDTLLESYLGWHQRKDVDLWIVGLPWESKELRRFGSLDEVKLIVGPDDDELSRIYSSAAAFVFPSLYEGFGIPLLEAMACGCPIVASRIPSTIEVAGDIPYYFEARNSEDLLSALDRALAERKPSERIARGLLRARDFSWDRTARLTLDVYKSLGS